MQPSDVSDITRQALFLVIQVAAPILLISLIIGLIVSIFQTVTSIQEQTLTFVPKIILTFLGIILLGNWMLTQLITYIHTLWDDFSIYIR